MKLFSAVYYCSSVSIYIQGKFYFGEMLPVEEECDENISAVSLKLILVALMVMFFGAVMSVSEL